MSVQFIMFTKDLSLFEFYSITINLRSDIITVLLKNGFSISTTSNISQYEMHQGHVHHLS